MLSYNHPRRLWRKATLSNFFFETANKLVLVAEGQWKRAAGPDPERVGSY